jgi:hypothetical protein|tara:strand:+ start:466 stop:597 length:132 start_codon:yes stop_codon:yes gene_type:complete
VVIAPCILIVEVIVVLGKLLALKILTLAINGDGGVLKDNARFN